MHMMNKSFNIRTEGEQKNVKELVIYQWWHSDLNASSDIVRMLDSAVSKYGSKGVAIAYEKSRSEENFTKLNRLSKEDLDELAEGVFPKKFKIVLLSALKKYIEGGTTIYPIDVEKDGAVDKLCLEGVRKIGELSSVLLDAARERSLEIESLIENRKTVLDLLKYDLLIPRDLEIRKNVREVLENNPHIKYLLVVAGGAHSDAIKSEFIEDKSVEVQVRYESVERVLGLNEAEKVLLNLDWTDVVDLKRNSNEDSLNIAKFGMYYLARVARYDSQDKIIEISNMAQAKQCMKELVDAYSKNTSS